VRVAHLSPPEDAGVIWSGLRAPAHKPPLLKRGNT
jgi:hypothetical protein